VERDYLERVFFWFASFEDIPFQGQDAPPWDDDGWSPDHAEKPDDAADAESCGATIKMGIPRQSG
jgi:hypothetical protein